MPSVMMATAHCPSDEIAAGWPSKSCRSTSAALACSCSTRSVLQKRHLMAAVLIVSPHTGHGLVSPLGWVSSLTLPPLQPLTTNHEPPTTNDQPPTTNQKLPPSILARDLQPRASGRYPWRSTEEA